MESNIIVYLPNTKFALSPYPAQTHPSLGTDPQHPLGVRSVGAHAQMGSLC